MSSDIHTGMKCKSCAENLPRANFSKIKRANSTTYRLSCKKCEYDKFLARKLKKKDEEPRIPAPNDGPGVDVNKLAHDPEGMMPSDSDLLYWSTPFFELIVDSRNTLMNEEPDEK